jgi:putative ABC transport system permease protein
MPPADRCTSRLARPARAEDALAGAAARLGDQPARAADLGGRAGGEPGLAVPGAAAAGEGRGSLRATGARRRTTGARATTGSRRPAAARWARSWRAGAASPPVSKPFSAPPEFSRCTWPASRVVDHPEAGACMSWIDGARTRLRLLFARNAAEARMDDEIRFHLEMETERLMREEGLDAGEARRRALLAFGGVEKHRRRCGTAVGRRGSRGCRSTEARLPDAGEVSGPDDRRRAGDGVRHLGRRVTFQLVGCCAVPVAAAAGRRPHRAAPQLGRAANAPEPRALHDFVVWRDALRTVTDIGAFRDATRNLVVAGDDARPVAGRGDHASAFRIAPRRRRCWAARSCRRTSGPGAPPVVVLGTTSGGALRRRLRVLGRTVQLGDTYATVVGVMPDGYAFPVAHDAWTPLRPTVDRCAAHGPRHHDLRPPRAGASLATRRRSWRRSASARPPTSRHARAPAAAGDAVRAAAGGSERLRPRRVRRSTCSRILLLVLICGNVALLLFARAATRESEIVVRSALGASRSRIGVQLFARGARARRCCRRVGLAAAHFALNHWGEEFLETNLGRLPFWSTSACRRRRCSTPRPDAARRGDRRRAARAQGHARPRRAPAAGHAGGGGLQFGGVWTAVIVAQVAVTVAFPAVGAGSSTASSRGMQSYDPASRPRSTSACARHGRGRPRRWTTRARSAARFVTSLEMLRQRVRAARRAGRDLRRPAAAPVPPRATHRARRRRVTPATAYDAQQELPRSTSPPSTRRTSTCCSAPILAGRGFGPADSSPARARSSWTRASWTRCCADRTRSAGACASPLPPPHGPTTQASCSSSRGTRSSASCRSSACATRRRPAARQGSTCRRARQRRTRQHGRARARRADGAGGRPHARHGRRSDAAALGFQRLDRVVDDMLWIRRPVAAHHARAHGHRAAALAGRHLRRAVLHRRAPHARDRRARRARREPASPRGRDLPAAAHAGRCSACSRAPASSRWARPLVRRAIPLGDGATSGAGGCHSRSRASRSSRATSVSMLGVCLLACIVPLRRALGVEPTEALRAQ